MADSDTSTLDSAGEEQSCKTQPIDCPGRPLAHTDSGYGTGNNTSFVSPSDKTKELLPDDDEVQIPVKSVPLPGKEELQIFRTNMDHICNARFQEIAPEMQRQLLKSVQKGASFFPSSKARSRRPITMSMRLMMIGETIDLAKPSVVIFLPGEGASLVESVLEQPVLRQLYKPDDGITPSFDVVVVSQAPRKRFCQEVEVIWDTNLSGERDLSTYCGVQICLQTPRGGSAMATLGGVVKLTYGPGDFKLVGMTAGHVLEELFDADDSKPADSETVEEESQAPTTNRQGLRFTYPRAVGTVLYPQLDDDVLPEELNELMPACDWALFEINPALKIRPNLAHQVGVAASHLRRTANSGIINGRTMTTAPPESFPTIEPIEVALLGGSSHFGGTMLGLLSHVSGGIMLFPEQGFVDAYLLTLDEGQELQDGDSGSWVVNPISMEVYGHVVATDITGDAYIVPLHRTFDEMSQVLGVESVDLPRTADLLDAALRASAVDVFGSYGSGKGTMEECPRERRVSEVFLLCEGWQLWDLKRAAVYDDGDSGYGSIGSNLGGTPFDVAIEDDEGDVDTVAW